MKKIIIGGLITLIGLYFVVSPIYLKYYNKKMEFNILKKSHELYHSLSNETHRQFMSDAATFLCISKFAFEDDQKTRKEFLDVYAKILNNFDIKHERAIYIKRFTRLSIEHINTINKAETTDFNRINLCEKTFHMHIHSEIPFY